jgi:hypothetical protein
VEQLVLFGCKGCQAHADAPFCDDCLRQILVDSRTGGAEHWAGLDAYPGYHVSSLGQVRSPRGRILKPGFQGKGYPAVHLGGRWRRVGQLVLEAFIGDRPPGFMALHYNDDKLDNRLWNVYWGTGYDNYVDAVRNGRHRNVEYPSCSIAGCDEPARAPGAKCEVHYRLWRREVAVRAMALSARIG